MTPLTQQQREDLRFAAREQLVNASTVALARDMVLRRIERSRMIDFAFTVEDVESALEFLVGLGHASAVPTALGATKYFQATAAGVLAHERGQ